MADVPIVVKSVTGVWTAVGAWISALGILAGLGTAIIKQWGPWQKQASDDRAADFARLRIEVQEAREEARQCRAAVQRLDHMVSCMGPAISILTAEVRRLDPDAHSNPAILQVQELMKMAAAGDFGVGLGLRAMAGMRGTGE